MKVGPPEKPSDMLMCQIANSRNFSGIWRGCVTSSLRINQIMYLGCFSHLEHFGHLLDPEEVVQINSPPHATCYLESILMYLSI